MRKCVDWKALQSFWYLGKQAWKGCKINDYQILVVFNFYHEEFLLSFIDNLTYQTFLAALILAHPPIVVCSSNNFLYSFFGGKCWMPLAKESIQRSQMLCCREVGRLGRAVRKKTKATAESTAPNLVYRLPAVPAPTNIWSATPLYTLLPAFLYIFPLFFLLYIIPREWGTESDELLEKVPNGHHIGKLFFLEMRNTTAQIYHIPTYYSIYRVLPIHMYYQHSYS